MPKTRKKILVVEDDADQRRLLKTALEGAGYFVHTAFSGEQAVVLAELMLIDLIVLDIMLLTPMDGVEALCRVKANPATSSIPVMIVSAHLDQERIELLLQAGAELYMTKPYDVFVLLDTVGQMLAARAGHLDDNRLRRKKEASSDSAEP